MKTRVEIFVLSQMLENWMYKRFLKYENQQSNFINLTNEELDEFKNATSIDDEIDALCDILVFSFNSVRFDKNDTDFIKIFDKDNILFDDIVVIRDILSKDFSYSNLYCLYDAIKKYLENRCISLFKAMLETYKEIDSRTGEWNEEKQKWLKYKTPEAMAKWYKANYKSCLI